MGNKVKSVKKTQKRSYKLRAEHMNDIKRMKIVENHNTEAVSNALETLKNHDDCELNDKSTHSYKRVLEEASNSQVIAVSVSQSNFRTSNQNQDKDGLSYSIEMDNPTPKTNISIGRRIINVSYFLEKLYEISNHGPLDCGLTCIELVSEKLHGLSSIFTFLCKMCNRKFVIGNDDDNCLPINTCVVAGIISIGCGHSQLQELSSAMNLPMMSQKTYQTNHKLLSQNWQQLAQQSMEQAAEEEKKWL
ncbi:uncharacterized protein LOC124530227 [Vanessa cardui]|uniref:uncharacterized protein LOC124530227 n=1 Tax=Vanessa cardui TaxID=171605 RepID=UPI001F146561|nr:uncharacterized protein LOC124530227 [Vanessa cardui]